jgi:hypothetical protein
MQNQSRVTIEKQNSWKKDLLISSGTNQGLKTPNPPLHRILLSILSIPFSPTSPPTLVKQPKHPLITTIITIILRPIVINNPIIPTTNPINLTRARRLASSPWARSGDRSEDIPNVLSLECVGKQLAPDGFHLGDAGGLEEGLELVGLQELAFACRGLGSRGRTVITMPSSASIRAAKETACSGLI